MKERLLTPKVFLNSKNLYLETKMLREAILNQISNLRPLANTIDYIKKIQTNQKKLHTDNDLPTKSQNKEFHNIRQLQNSMHLFYPDQTVKCFKEFHQKNPAINTQIKIFCIFVLRANVNAYVLNV